MKFLVLLLLLLVPSTAFADSTFDISCENVKGIYIVRNNDSRLIRKSYPGPFHVVRFVLKSNAAKEFMMLVKASRSYSIHSNGIDYDSEKLTITASGKPLRNDEPEVDAHGEGEVGTVILREQDAFDAARSVCPALVPAKLLIDGRLE